MKALENLPVIFRAERSGKFKGHVTAVFPSLASDYSGEQMTCYAHVGQHSACSMEWMRETRPATPAEYADLFAELKGIYENPDDEPVKLILRHRVTQAHRAERLAQARQSRAAVQADPRGAPFSPEGRAAAFAPA